MKVGAGGDPECRPCELDPGQQKSGEGGRQGAGFGFQPEGTNLVQMAERQAAARQAGIHRGIAESEQVSGMCRGTETIPQGDEMWRQRGGAPVP
jgi:hypothetical protein